MSDKLRGDNSGQYRAATASATFSCSLPGMRSANLSQVGSSQSANPGTTLYGVQKHDSSGVNSVLNKGQTSVPRHSNVQSELEMAFQKRLRQPKKKFPKEAPNSSTSADDYKSPPPQVNNVPPVCSTISSASVSSPSQSQPQKYSHFSSSSPPPPPRSSSLHKTTDITKTNGQTLNVSIPGYRRVKTRGSHTPRSFNQDFSDFTDSEDCRTPDVSIFNMSEGYRTPLESEDEADTASKHSYAASSTRFPFKSEIVKQFEKPVPVFLKCQSWCNQLPDEVEPRQPINDPNLSKELQNIESFESAMLDWFQTLNRTNDNDDLRSETSVSSMGSCKSEYKLRSLINNRFQNSQQIENVLTDLLAISDQYAQATDTESVISESQKSVQTLKLQKVSQPRRGRATVIRRSSVPGDVSGSESESEPPMKHGDYKSFLSELQGVLRQRRPIPETPDSEESGLGSSEYSNPPTSPLSPTSIPPTPPKPQFPKVHAPKAVCTAQVTRKPLVNAGDFKFFLGELSTAWSKRLKRIRKAQMVSQRGMQSSLYANFQGFRIPETLIEDKSTKYANFQGKLEPAKIIDPENTTNVNKEPEPSSESVSKPMFCQIRGQGTEKQVLPSEIAKKETMLKPQKQIEAEPPPLKEMTGQELLESVQKPGLKKTTFKMNKYIRNVASGGVLPEISEEISISSPSQHKLVSALNKGNVPVTTSGYSEAPQSMQHQIPSTLPGQMNFQPQTSHVTQFTNVRSSALIQSPLPSQVKSSPSVTSHGTLVSSCSSPLPPSPQINSDISSEVNTPQSKVRVIASPPKHEVWSPPLKPKRFSTTQIKSSPSLQETIVKSPPPAIITPPQPPPKTVRSTVSPPPPVHMKTPPQIPIPPPPPILEPLVNNSHTDIKAEPSKHPLPMLPHSGQGSPFTIPPQMVSSTSSSSQPVQVKAPPQSPMLETQVNNINNTNTQIEPFKPLVPTLLSHDRQASAFTVPPSRSGSTTSNFTEKVDKIKAENTLASSDPTIQKALLNGVTDLSDQLKSTITEVVKKTEENLQNNLPADKAISTPCFTSSETVNLNSKVSYAFKPVRSSPVISRSITPTSASMNPALIEEKRLILERLTKIGERNVIAKEELPELPMDIMKASAIKIKPLVTENIHKLVHDVREGSKEGSPMIDELRHLKKSEVVMEIQSPTESPDDKNQSNLSVDMNIPLLPNEPEVSEFQALPEKSMLALERMDEGMETSIQQTCFAVTDLMPESTYDVDFEKNVRFFGSQSADGNKSESTTVNENKQDTTVSHTVPDSVIETPIPETDSLVTDLIPEISYLKNQVGFLDNESTSLDENKPDINVSDTILESQIEIPVPETDSLVTNLIPEISYDVDLKNQVGFLTNQSVSLDEIKPDINVFDTILESQIEIPVPETDSLVTDLMPKISYDVDLKNQVGCLDNQSTSLDENKPDINVSDTILESQIEIPVPETDSLVTNLIPEISYDVDLKNQVGFLTNQSVSLDEIKPDINVFDTILESQIEIPVPETDSLVTDLMPKISYDVDLKNQVGCLDNQSTSLDENKPDINVSDTILESQIEIPVPETDSLVTNLIPEISYDVDLKNQVGFLTNQSVSLDENKPDINVSDTILESQIEIPVPETDSLVTDLMPKISYDIDLKNQVGFLTNQSVSLDENKSDINVSDNILESQIEIPVPETDSLVTNLMPEISYDIDLKNNIEFLDNQSTSNDEIKSDVCVSHTELDSLMETVLLNIETMGNFLPDGEMPAKKEPPTASKEDEQSQKMNDDSVTFPISLSEHTALLEMQENDNSILVTSQENKSLEMTENELMGKYLIENYSRNVEESLTEKNSKQTCELQATFVDEPQEEVTSIVNQKNLEETFEVSIEENTHFNGDDVSYSIVFDDSGDTRIPSEEELENLWINPVISRLAIDSESTIVKEEDTMSEEVIHVNICSDERAALVSLPETISTKASEFLAVIDIVEDKPNLETVADIVESTTNPELLQEWSTVLDAETEKLIMNPGKVSTAELQAPEAIFLEEVSNYNVFSDNITDDITVPDKITELAQLSHFIPVFSPLEPEMPVFENPPDVFKIPVQEVVPTVMDSGAFVEISGQKEILFVPAEQEELMDEPEISLDQLKQSIKEEMLKSEDITKVFDLENLKSLGPNGSPDDYEYEDAVCYSSDDSLTFEDTLTSPIMSRRVYKEVVRAEIGSRVETLQSWAKPEPLKSWPNQENLQLCSEEDLAEDSDLHEFHEAEEIISNTDSDVLFDSDQQQLVYTLPTIYEATDESVEEERRILREINHVDQLIGECVETLEMSPVELAQVQEQDQILCDAEIPDFISEIELERDVQLDSVLSNLKSGAPFSAGCAPNEPTVLFGELKRSQGLTALDQICIDQSPESKVQDGSPPEKISSHTSPIFSDDEMLHSIPYNVTIERPELFEEEILPAMSTKTIFDKMGVGKILEDNKFEETEDEISPAQLRSEKTSEDEEENIEDWLKKTSQTNLQLPRLVQSQQPLVDKFENLLEYLGSDAAKELQEFERIESACEILSKDHRKDSVVSDFSIGTIGKSDDFELLIKSLDSELEEDMTQNVLANPEEDLVPGVIMIPQNIEQHDMDTFDYKSKPEKYGHQIKACGNDISLDDTCEDDFFDAYSETEYLEYMLSRDPEDSGYIDAVLLHNTPESEFEQMMLQKESTVQEDIASSNISSFQVDEGVDEDDLNDIDSNYLSYMREREMETYEMMTEKNTVISDTTNNVEDVASRAVDEKSTPHLELVITVPESEQEHETMSEDISLAPDSLIEADEKPLFISDEIEEEFFTIKGTENTVEKAFEYLLSSKTLSVKEDNDTSPDPKTDHSLSTVENSSSASEDPLSPGNYSVSHADHVADQLHAGVEVHKLHKLAKKHARKNKKIKNSKDGNTLLTETSSENISTEQESVISLCTSETKVIETDNVLKVSSPHISRSKNDVSLLSVCESELAGQPTTKTRLASTSSSSTERSASCEHAVLPPGSIPLTEDGKDTITAGKKKRKKKKKKGKEKEEPISQIDIKDNEKLNSDQVEFNVEMKHESNIDVEIDADISKKEARDDIQNDSKDSEKIDSLEEFSTKDQGSDLPMLSMAVFVPEMSSEEIGSQHLASKSSTLIIATEMSIEKEVIPPPSFVSESPIMESTLQEMSAISSESAEEISSLIIASALQEMSAISSKSAEEISSSIVTPSLEVPTVSSKSAEEVSFSVVAPSLEEITATSSQSAEDVSFSIMPAALQEIPATSLELAEEVSSSIIASALQEMSVISSKSTEEISSEKQDVATGELSDVTLASALKSLNHVGLSQDEDINSAVSLNQPKSFSKQITNEVNDSTKSIVAVVVPETSIDVSISGTITKEPVSFVPYPELEQTLPIVSSDHSHLEAPTKELDSVTSLQQSASVALSPSSTINPVAVTPSSSSSKQPASVASVPSSPPSKQCAPVANLTASSLKESIHFTPLLSSTTRSSSLSSLNNRECQIHRSGAKCPLKIIEHRTDFSESYQKKAAFLANLPRPVEYPRLYRCPSSEARFGQPPPVPCSLRDMEPPPPPARKLSKDNVLSDSVQSQNEIGAPLCSPEDTKLASPILERSKNTNRNGLNKSSTLTKSPQIMTQTNSPSKRFRDLKHFSRISNMTYNEVIEMEEEENRRRYDFGTGRRLREMRYFGRICHGDSEESMISKKSESSDSGILTGYRDLKQSTMMTTSSTSLQTPGMSATGGCRPKGLADSAVSIDNPGQFEPVMSYVAYGQSGDVTATEIQRYSSSVSGRSNTLQPSDRHHQNLSGYGQIQKAHDMVRSTQSLDYHAGHSKFIRPEMGLSEQDVTSQGFQDSGLCASNCSVNGHESDDSRSMRSSVSFVIPEHRTMENIVMDDDSESIYEDVAMYPSSDTMSLRSDVGSVKSLSKLKKFGSKLKKFSKIKFKKFWK